MEQCSDDECSDDECTQRSDDECRQRSDDECRWGDDECSNAASELGDVALCHVTLETSP